MERSGPYAEQHTPEFGILRRSVELRALRVEAPGFDVDSIVINSANFAQNVAARFAEHYRLAAPRWEILEGLPPRSSNPFKRPTMMPV